MTRFPKHLVHEHSAEAIRKRLQGGSAPSYIRDFVYGGIDGAITTFAIVAGVVGADLGTATILILGVANLVADGFSMAAGNYLATKSENDEKNLIEDYERSQIKENPKGERQEVRQIFKEQGYTGELLEQAVELITKDPDSWVKLMLAEEYGLAGEPRSPYYAALSTFVAFSIFGFIPILPTVFAFDQSFFWSCILTGIAFFLIGSLKSRWSVDSWWKSGGEAFLVGAVAAGLAYGIGYALRALVGVAT